MKDKIKIMIVEDEPVILRSVKRGIEQFGESFQVSAEAFDGKEALEKMRDSCPDIVISDIVMPQMGGLEMIERANSEGLRSKFILLSGYGEFKYAQKALDIGVTKYLLKPVDFQELGILLEEMKEEILQTKRRRQEELIRDLLDERKNGTEGGLSPYYMLIAVIWGTMGRSGFYEFHPAADIIRAIDFDFLRDMELRLGKEIYGFPGHYANSYLFVIPSEAPRWKNISEAAGQVSRCLYSDESFVTVCFTDRGVESGKFREKLRELYCELPARIIFGENQVLRCPKDVPAVPVPGGVVRRAVNEMHISMDKGHLKEILDYCCQYWKSEKMTQIGLQAELRYLFENPKIHHRMEPMEFLYHAYSYDDLKEQLFLELSTVLHLDESGASHRSALLVERVREYLDIHFAEEISYKEFNCIFGYSEKYITAVFKEKLGVTPSRYVLEKKMELARRLMSQERGLLLREVAQRVGYSDQLYFSKVFKNCTGMSPSSYMKREKGGRQEMFKDNVRE